MMKLANDFGGSLNISTFFHVTMTLKTFYKHYSLCFLIFEFGKNGTIQGFQRFIAWDLLDQKRMGKAISSCNQVLGKSQTSGTSEPSACKFSSCDLKISSVIQFLRIPRKSGRCNWYDFILLRVSFVNKQSHPT